MDLWNRNRKKKHGGKYTAVLMAVILAVLMMFTGCGAGNGGSGTNGGYSKESVRVETAGQETSAQETAVAEVSESESAGQETPESEPSEQAIAGAEASEPESAEQKASEPETISEDGWYSDKEQVALYLHTYNHLPDNYITKTKAQKLGWDARTGNLWDVAPGMSIGGGKFGNREGNLPDKKGRTYYECDIDYEGGHRGAKRIVYSNDGLVYYTEDHYESFELLYGEEE